MRWKHVTWERYGRIVDDETKHKQLLKARMLAERRRRIILVLERAGMAGCLARPPPGVAPFGCDWLSPAVLRRSPLGCIPGPTNVVLMTALRLEIKRTLHSRRMLHGPLVVDVPPPRYYRVAITLPFIAAWSPAWRHVPVAISIPDSIKEYDPWRRITSLFLIRLARSLGRRTSCNRCLC